MTSSGTVPPTFTSLNDFGTFLQTQAQTLASQIQSSDWPDAQNTYGLISNALPQSGALIGALAQQTQGSTYSGPISASVADIQQQLSTLQTVLFSLTGQSSTQVQTAQQAAAQIQSDASSILTQAYNAGVSGSQSSADTFGQQEAAARAAQAAAAAAAAAGGSTTTTTDPTTGVVTTTTSNPTTGQTTVTTTNPTTGQSSTTTSPTTSVASTTLPAVTATPVTASVPVVVAVGLGCAGIAALLVWMAHAPMVNPVPSSHGKRRRRTRGRRRAR